MFLPLFSLLKNCIHIEVWCCQEILSKLLIIELSCKICQINMAQGSTLKVPHKSWSASYLEEVQPKLQFLCKQQVLSII